MMRLEIRRAIAGTRKVVIVNTVTCEAKVIEPGLGAEAAAEFAERWARVLGIPVADITHLENERDRALRRGGGNARGRGPGPSSTRRYRF